MAAGKQNGQGQRRGVAAETLDKFPPGRPGDREKRLSGEFPDTHADKQGGLREDKDEPGQNEFESTNQRHQRSRVRNPHRSVELSKAGLVQKEPAAGVTGQ